MNPETTPRDEQITYWMLSALSAHHSDGGTIDGLESAIDSLKSEIAASPRYGGNLSVVVDGWQKALDHLKAVAREP